MTNNEIAEELEEMFLEDQPLSPEDKKLVETIYDRFDIFSQMNKPYHETARECRQILHMEDPKQDDEKTIEQNGKKTLQLQTLKSTFNNVVADQMLSMPEARLLPETENMQEAADDLQDLCHYAVYCANDFGRIHHKRCEDFYGPGTAVTQITWDRDMAYGKGEIAIIRWPLEAFLWDPLAERIEDCRAVMKVSWHPLSWFREHWPEEGRYVGPDGDREDIGKTEGQTDTEHSSDEKRALLVEYWWRTYDAKTRRYTINVAYAAGGALLEKQLDVYDHGRYPFVLDVHDQIEGALPGEGLVHELVPMMRYINRYAAYMDMNARRASKGRLLVRRDAGIDVEALANWENDIIEGENIRTDALVWMQNQPFTNSITNLMTMFQSDLKADSGANQFTRGETTGGIVSGKAINSLIQAGGKVSSMRTEQLKSGFREMIEQVIWLMAQFYDDDRTVLITGREGKPKAIKVDTKKLFGEKTKGAVNPPPYTVQIEVSSRDPQRIANQNQMFMEAYTMSAQAQQFFPLSALFTMLNLDGKDRILPVLKANEHYQEQMQMLQQQVQELTAQLDTMQKTNQNLRKTVNTTATALADAGASGGQIESGTPPTTSAKAGQGPDEISSIVEASRSSMGQPTGMPLPT